jgi:hypothetical protein
MATIFFPGNVQKRTYGSAKHEWEDNIKLDLKEAAHLDVNWIHLARAHEEQSTG